MKTSIHKKCIKLNIIGWQKGKKKLQRRNDENIKKGRNSNG